MFEIITKAFGNTNDPKWGGILGTLLTMLIGGATAMFAGGGLGGIALGLLGGAVGGTMLGGTFNYLADALVGKSGSAPLTTSTSGMKANPASVSETGLDMEVGDNTTRHTTLIKPSLKHYQFQAIANEAKENAQDISDIPSLRANLAITPSEFQGELRQQIKDLHEKGGHFIKNLELWNERAEKWNKERHGELKEAYQAQQSALGNTAPDDVAKAPIIKITIPDITPELAAYAKKRDGSFDTINKTPMDRITKLSQDLQTTVQRTKPDWERKTVRSYDEGKTRSYFMTGDAYPSIATDYSVGTFRIMLNKEKAEYGWDGKTPQNGVSITDTSRITQWLLNEKKPDYETALKFAKLGEALAEKGGYALVDDEIYNYVHGGDQKKFITKHPEQNLAKRDKAAADEYRKMQEHIRALQAQEKLRPLEQEMYDEIANLKEAASNKLEPFVTHINEIEKNALEGNKLVKEMDAKKTKGKERAKETPSAKNGEKEVSALSEEAKRRAVIEATKVGAPLKLEEADSSMPTLAAASIPAKQAAKEAKNPFSKKGAEASPIA